MSDCGCKFDITGLTCEHGKDFLKPILEERDRVVEKYEHDMERMEGVCKGLSSQVARYKAALENVRKAKERNPEDDEDYGYNRGIEEALRIFEEEGV